MTPVKGFFKENGKTKPINEGNGNTRTRKVYSSSRKDVFLKELVETVAAGSSSEDKRKEGNNDHGLSQSALNFLFLHEESDEEKRKKVFNEMKSLVEGKEVLVPFSGKGIVKATVTEVLETGTADTFINDGETLYDYWNDNYPDKILPEDLVVRVDFIKGQKISWANGSCYPAKRAGTDGEGFITDILGRHGYPATVEKE